jgi:putative flippase GtrA
MMTRTAANSCWERQLEEIRRRVHQRRFWQDVEETQFKLDSLARNPDGGGTLPGCDPANSCASNVMRAIAADAEESDHGKTLACNHLRGYGVNENTKFQGKMCRREEIAKKSTRRETFLRWWKFNFVGGIGIAVQFAALFLLKSVLHLNYLAATALAVEIAVLHNFCWHERFTWADRLTPVREPRTSGAKALPGERSVIAELKRCATQSPWRSSFARLARFHLGNGAVSMLGNLALMKILVGEGHMNYLAANTIAIVMCSCANFLVSDKWVFGEQGRCPPPRY